LVLSCFGKKVPKEADLRGATGKCAPLRIPRRFPVTFYKEPSSAFQTTLRQHCLRNDTLIFNFPFSIKKKTSDRSSFLYKENHALDAWFNKAYGGE